MRPLDKLNNIKRKSMPNANANLISSVVYQIRFRQTDPRIGSISTTILAQRVTTDLVSRYLEDKPKTYIASNYLKHSSTNTESLDP